MLSCHGILLAYYSSAFLREMQDQIGRGTAARFSAFDKSVYVPRDIQRMISWLYTGLLDADADPALVTGDAAKKLYTMAVDLEMPEFANHIMTALLCVKYTHHHIAGPLIPELCSVPYLPDGLMHMMNKMKGDTEGPLQPLRLFFLGLLAARPPLVPAIQACLPTRVRSEDYVSAWRQFVRGPSIDPWLQSRNLMVQWEPELIWWNNPSFLIPIREANKNVGDTQGWFDANWQKIADALTRMIRPGFDLASVARTGV